MICVEDVSFTLTLTTISIGSVFILNAFFGQGTGPIAVRNVQCSGSEARLIDCTFGSFTCSHSDDAGVRCLVQIGN